MLQWLSQALPVKIYIVVKKQIKLCVFVLYGSCM